MNKELTIFGREPAVVVGLIEAVLAVLLSFGLGITQDSYGPWVAVVVAVGGIVTALGTKDTLLGAVVAALKAGIVLVAVYGVTLTDQQTASLVSFVPVVFMLWQRTQTSPLTAAKGPDGVYAVPEAGQ